MVTAFGVKLAPKTVPLEIITVKGFPASFWSAPMPSLINAHQTGYGGGPPTATPEARGGGAAQRRLG
jgi:hypothetical protein